MFDRFKLFRDKGTVASGVDSDVKDKITGKKRSLKTRGKIDISKLDSDDKIRIMVEDLIETDSLDVTLETLERYAQEGDEEVKAFLERFKKISAQVKIDQRSDALSYRIEVLVEELKDLLKGADELVAYDKFKEVLNKEASDIDLYANGIVKGLDEYMRKRAALKRAVAEYEKDFGTYMYDNVDICTPLEVRARYELIAKRINQLRNELTNAPADKQGYIKAKISSLENLVPVLPSLLGDPSKFDAIKKNVDESLNKTYKTKEDDKVKLYNELRNLLVASRESLMNKLRKLDYTLNDDIRDLNNKLTEVVGKYSLSVEEKNEIRNRVTKEVKLFPEVNDELYKAIVGNRGLLDAIHYAVEPVYNLNLSGEEFKAALNNIVNVVAGLKSNPVLVAHGAKIDFDEKNYTLNIYIPEVGISYSKQVFDVKKHQDDTALKVDKILEEYADSVKAIYADKMITYLNLVSRMENIELTKFDELITNKGNVYKDMIVALGVNEATAIGLIDRKALDVANECNRGYSKKDLEVVDFVKDNLVEKFAYIKKGISELSKFEYGTQEFKDKYSEVQQLINKFISYVNSDECKKYGISMLYDEVTEKIAIDYNCSLLQPFGMEVLTNEALVAKNKAKGSEKPAPAPSGDSGAPAPTPEPIPTGTPEPKPEPVVTEEQLQDQQVYIELMNVINEKIRELNGINNQLYTFEKNIELTDEFVRNNIRYERQARNLDFEVLSLKTELSTRRAQYARKYKQLLFSNTTIRDMKFEEIKFPVNYQAFVQEHDTLVVEAEMKIAELAEEKKSNPSAAQEVMNKINVLLEFIDSQNSVIGRSLVAESQVSNIDIVEMLQKRREFKKQLREQLRNGKGQPEINPEPVPPIEPPKDDEPLGVTITGKSLKFNPRKKPIIDRQYCSILTGVETLKVSVIKNGLKIKYSKDLAEKLQNVKNSLARLALVNKNNYRSRKNVTLDIPVDGTEVETELSFKNKEEINPDDYKLEVRNDDGVIYEYDLADLPEEEKGRSR